MRPKGILIGLYVPVHFAIKTGHFRSALAGRAVDARGHRIPWYTFPAVRYVSSLDFSGARILEYGGGQSTPWWSERVRAEGVVQTIEEDPTWAAELASLELSNVELVREPYGGPFDVVIVDGGERRDNARMGLDVLADDGIMIIDNSQGDWGTPEAPYPMIRLMSEAGMCRVDFVGYSSGVRRMSSTSIFFRGGPDVLCPPALPGRPNRLESD